MTMMSIRSGLARPLSSNIANILAARDFSPRFVLVPRVVESVSRIIFSPKF